MEEKDYSLPPADGENVKRQTLKRPTPARRRALSVRPTTPRSHKAGSGHGMEEKKPPLAPADQTKEQDTGSVTEPDLASYYAAAASAAVSGHTFDADKTPSDASPDAPAQDESSAEAPSAQTPADRSGEDDAAMPEDANTPADISGDGSPHGPLDFFSEEKKESAPEQEDAPSGQEEAGAESEQTEPVPPYEDAPVIAAFQTPEKPEERTPQARMEDEDEEEEGAEDDVPMSIIGHLNELRRRLFRIVIIVLLGFVAFYGVSEPLYGILSAPLQACMPEGSKLIYTSPQGAFFTYMKVALVASLFGTSPFSFYQIWAFIAPGLYREERRAVLPLAFFSSIFFLAGASFCFFLVFPIAFQFFMGFATDTIVPMISVEEYLSFALKLLIAFGVVFEMPLFAYFLSRFGLLTPAFMRRSRRYAILVIFIVAAILTPPDVFSQCLMALPMLLLYEVSIYVSAMAYRKKDEGKKTQQPETTEEKEA